jgi:hypothetical protein
MVLAGGEDTAFAGLSPCARVEALLGGHRERRLNRGEAEWLVTVGRWVIAYEHPDGDDPLVARVMTVWRQR